MAALLQGARFLQLEADAEPAALIKVLQLIMRETMAASWDEGGALNSSALSLAQARNIIMGNLCMPSEWSISDCCLIITHQEEKVRRAAKVDRDGSLHDWCLLSNQTNVVFVDIRGILKRKNTAKGFIDSFS